MIFYLSKTFNVQSSMLKNRKAWSVNRKVQSAWRIALNGYEARFVVRLRCSSFSRDRLTFYDTSCVTVRRNRCFSDSPIHQSTIFTFGLL